MTPPTETAGTFSSGLPYNRFGHGPRPLVIFQGLDFANRPLTGLMEKQATGAYRFLEPLYTCSLVTRRPGLPAGYSLQDMADDYAGMIQEEFGGPVDVIGISTGGSIALHFAVRHPDLLRKLVIHSGAHTLSPAGRSLQMRVAHLAKLGRWREAWAELLRFIFPHNPWARGMAQVGAWILAREAPDDPADLVVTVEAEDAHACRAQLKQISAPTLVIAGEADPFFTPQLLRETAEGIPNAQLILYPKMGHPAAGKQFERDALAFLQSEV